MKIKVKFKEVTLPNKTGIVSMENYMPDVAGIRNSYKEIIRSPYDYFRRFNNLCRDTSTIPQLKKLIDNEYATTFGVCSKREVSSSYEMRKLAVSYALLVAGYWDMDISIPDKVLKNFREVMKDNREGLTPSMRNLMQVDLIDEENNLTDEMSKTKKESKMGSKEGVKKIVKKVVAKVAEEVAEAKAGPAGKAVAKKILKKVDKVISKKDEAAKKSTTKKSSNEPKVYESWIAVLKNQPKAKLNAEQIIEEMATRHPDKKAYVAGDVKMHLRKYNAGQITSQTGVPAVQVKLY